jgi:hypothetical protein
MADLIEVTLAMDSEDVVKTLKNMEKLEKEIVRLQAGYTRLKQFQGTANLTQKQYAIGVAQTDAKIAHLTKTLHSGSAAINKHAEHLVQSKNKMSKFGMISQQVGYQVGDFFVQVQSGQSALVAFGQQGTQLAGLIPGIGWCYCRYRPCCWYDASKRFYGRIWRIIKIQRCYKEFNR